jgi:hypothetical protein
MNEVQDPIIVLGAFAVFGLGMGSVFFYRDVKQHLGLSFWRRRAIRAGGLRAQAKILDKKFKGAVGTGGEQLELIVEVQAQGQAPYRARVGEVFDIFRKGQASEGAVIPVFIDATQKDVIVIDFEALDRDIDHRRRGEERAEAERRARLMRGD